jgi:hypothetical protein
MARPLNSSLLFSNIAPRTEHKSDFPKRRGREKNMNLAGFVIKS